MGGDFWIILAVAGGAALASPLGGVLSILLPSSTLFLSLAVGMASGILLGTMAFEMVPTALESAPLGFVLIAIAVGVGLTYALDLFINRGRLVGEEADQKADVERYHRRHRPLGTMMTVLAVGTATEELIEGLSIGVASSIGVGTALVMGVAIAVDNVSEALSLGALAQSEDAQTARRRTLVWTSVVGASLFVSAMLGWFVLRDIPDVALALLLSVGAGAMFYLTITDLLPKAEQNQFQQSAAWAATLGLLTALLLAEIN
jgi:zinc transporter, ZIP family